MLCSKSVEGCAINTERVYDQTETEWLDMNLTKAETVYHSPNRKLYVSKQRSSNTIINVTG